MRISLRSHLFRMSSSLTKATPERSAELLASLTEIRSSVKAASIVKSPVLVAVSKYKPSSDILACYENDQRDFGENYVQELVDKAQALPLDIRWHFIGTLQSNKAKTLASIPNLYAIQTLTSQKAAGLLDKALPSEREPLNVLIQINTSGEESKSGLEPLTPDLKDVELTTLAKYIVTDCPRLRLQGLMTIGALEASLGAAETKENKDFETLKSTRDALEVFLVQEYGEDGRSKWGFNGKLLLSMGMSSDFEAALQSGSDIVRVGTGIFGERRPRA